MKKINSLILFLVISVLGQSLSAQKIFREGYIIKKSGESLTGLVEYSPKQKIPEVCKFKRFDIARIIDYSAKDILAFGYRDGNRYESRELNNKISFFEVLVAGKIVLYRKGSGYYLDKDHLGLVELNNGPFTYNFTEGRKEFSSLPDFLAYLTEGKAGKVPEKSNLKDEIVPFIAAYNKESGKEYNVFNRSMDQLELMEVRKNSGAGRNIFGVVSGVNLYKLNIKFNPNVSGSTLNNYVPNPDNEMGLAAGITYERLLFRGSDKISLRINLLYNSQDFYCFSDRPNDAGGRTLNDTYFDFKGIKVPLLFQYSFTGGKFVPYINAGVAYQYFLSTNYTHIAEVENYSHEIKTYEDHYMVFKKGEFSGVGGLGVRTKIFNSVNIHLMAFFEAGGGLFVNEFPHEMVWLKSKPYVQNSLQTTVLFGITF